MWLVRLLDSWLGEEVVITTRCRSRAGLQASPDGIRDQPGESNVSSCRAAPAPGVCRLPDPRTCPLLLALGLRKALLARGAGRVSRKQRAAALNVRDLLFPAPGFWRQDVPDQDF